MMKRILSIAMVLLLVMAMPLQVLAEEYDLALGDITVTADDSGQYVHQDNYTDANRTYEAGKGYKETSDTVITQGDPTTVTDNTITLESSGEASAEITLDGVNIESGDESAIDVAGDSSAVIHVEGENTVGALGDKYAGIHVDEGNLTIQGNSDDDELYVDSGSGGAAIGSRENEDFEGTITITGNVYVDTYAGGDGAGIGSGSAYEYGDFEGTVNILNGADVNAYSGTDGAGIGSGDGGEFEGTVNIVDSNVHAESEDEGAGIGAGENGDFGKDGVVNIINSTVYAKSDDDAAGIGTEDDFEGTVNIVDSNVTAIGDQSAGIGAGDSDSFSGTVNITGSTVFAEGEDGGAAIGGGGDGSEGHFSGELNIHDSTIYASTSGDGGTSLGTGENGDFTGTITITGNSEIHAMDSNYDIIIGAATGAQDGTVTIDSTVQLSNYNDNYPDPLPQELWSKAVGGHLIIGSQDLFADFWLSVYIRIQGAEENEELTVAAGPRTSIPTYVVKAVAEYNVKLIIQWNGGEDITITPDGTYDLSGTHIEFKDLI